MNSRKNIKDELHELGSQLPQDAGGSPYSVPEGYFDGLAGSVMAKINARNAVSAKEEIQQLSPLLASLPRTMPYTIPGDYFQSTIESVPALTSNEDSLVLSFIDKGMPYEVPVGYFAGLPDKILAKVPVPRARVVSMRKKWMRMAVAAAITGMVALGGIFYFSGKNEIPVDSPQWVAKELKNVSDKEIDEFVNTTEVISSSNITAMNKPVRTNDTEELFEDVTDRELEAFLDAVTIEEEEELEL